jgi:hypothetical protein
MTVHDCGEPALAISGRRRLTYDLAHACLLKMTRGTMFHEILARLRDLFCGR